MERFVIVLSGETYHHRGLIIEGGFTWQPKEKVWVKPVPNLLDYEQMTRQWGRLRGVTITYENEDKFENRWWRKDNKAT